MNDLISKRHFFADIDGVPYAVDIKDWNRSQESYGLRCGKCRGNVLTECDAATIPKERMEGMTYTADIALEGFGRREGSRRFIICDACGEWHEIDHGVRIIGDSPIVYSCIIDDRELSIPSRLAGLIELLFWETEKHACQIVAESIAGNGEYVGRLKRGLSALEHSELSNLIARMEP